MARILVVDDEPDVRELFNITLKMAGHTTETAKDGMEAVERLQTDIPDLILLDLMMPRLDGFGLLNHIRQKMDSKPIRVLVATAKVLEDSDQQKLDPWPVVGVLNKGELDIAAMVTIVSTALSKEPMKPADAPAPAEATQDQKPAPAPAEALQEQKPAPAATTEEQKPAAAPAEATQEQKPAATPAGVAPQEQKPATPAPEAPKPAASPEPMPGAPSGTPQPSPSPDFVIRANTPPPTRPLGGTDGDTPQPAPTLEPDKTAEPAPAANPANPVVKND